MNLKIQNRGKTGFTKVELLFVVVTILILAGMVWPMKYSGCKAKPERIQCISNLKQVALGIRLSYGDEPNFNTGLIPTNAAWNYFQTAGNEIGFTKVLLCPADKDRRRNSAKDFGTNATSFSDAAFRNNALSFFFGPDASDLEPNMILAGDRNLSTNKQMLKGVLTVETNVPLEWTEDLHESNGNVALADGSAHQVTTGKLREYVANGYSTNGLQRFVMPQ